MRNMVISMHTHASIYISWQDLHVFPAASFVLSVQLRAKEQITFCLLVAAALSNQPPCHRKRNIHFVDITHTTRKHSYDIVLFMICCYGCLGKL